MSREALINLIELVPEKDIQTIYNVVVKFIPETEPEPGELEELEEARRDRLKNGTISHNAINWD